MESQPPISPIGTPAEPVSSPHEHQQPAFNPAQHFEDQQHRHHHLLQAFWDNQMREIDQTVDFKNHALPLARIKKIMKADEEVSMISAEAPVLFAKASEMFILELTLRSWMHTEESKRRTLQKNDIAAAASRNEAFDFLVDIIPRDELREEVLPSYYVPTRAPGDQAAPSHSLASLFMPWRETTSGQLPTQQAPPE